MAVMRACAWGERRKQACNALGNTMSSMYLPRPETRRASSVRGWGLPMWRNASATMLLCPPHPDGGERDRLDNVLVASASA